MTKSPTAAVPGDPGMFGPDSVSWRVNAETTVLFGGARALLMHAAHPLVLAGARQTGFYERDPWKRLERTVRLSYTITFGSTAEARDAARRIDKAHEGVRGIDQVTGLPYDARDPELLLWVHACLVDSFLLFERLTVGRLDDADRQRFHEEQMAGVALIGLPPDRIPPTVDGLRAYIDSVIHGGTIRVTDEAARVADLIRRPPSGVPWRAVLRQVSWWAFATLPSPLRAAYGFRWNALASARLVTTTTALRLVRPAIPSRFREVVPARAARERVSATRIAAEPPAR